METKLNIAEILKDKPKGTKLYADAFGELSIEDICTGDELGITLSSKDDDELLFYNDGKYNVHGEPILVPSKEMRDWSKFAWKKGDLLVNSCGFQCIFKEWASNDYTKFNGCYSNSRDGYEDISNARTDKFDKLDNNVADGYILCVIDNFDKYHYILIYKGQDANYIYRYVAMFEDNSLNMKKNSYLTKPKDDSMRLATEEEKQQLFDALAKEGKAWDAEKKQIVDLKPKVELKPFDKVLVREEKYSEWQADFFSNIDEDNRFVCIGSTWSFCIPYNEETAKLMGTTNNVK